MTLTVAQFRERSRRAIDGEILPHYGEWERSGTLPRAAFRSMAEAGWTGHIVAPEHGGLGLSLRHSAALVEELQRDGMLGLVTSLLAQSHAVAPLLEALGTDEQHARYLGPLVRGELLAGIAITEPTGGSDLFHAVQTRAEDRGDHWSLTGEKMFISNGPVADFLVVLARTDPDRGPLGMTLFVVETTAPGFSVKQWLDKTGIRCSPTGWLEFRDCQVAKSAVLGRVNHGFPAAADRLIHERAVAAVAAVTSARTCLTAVLRAGCAGRRLIPLLAEVEAGQAFVDRLIGEGPTSRTFRQDAAAAKFLMADLLSRVSRECAIRLGADGFVEGSIVSRVMRDAQAMGVFAGSSETMRESFAAPFFAGLPNHPIDVPTSPRGEHRTGTGSPAPAPEPQQTRPVQRWR